VFPLSLVYAAAVFVAAYAASLALSLFLPIATLGQLQPRLEYNAIILGFLALTWGPRISVSRVLFFLLWLVAINVSAAFLSGGFSQLGGTYDSNKTVFDEAAGAIALTGSLIVQVFIDWAKGNLKESVTGQGEPIMRIIVSIVILAFAVAGFYLLHLGQGFLWLVFLLLGYPLALAITVKPDAISEQTILEMYKFGAQQIPGVGQVIMKFAERVGGSISSAPNRKKNPKEE